MRKALLITAMLVINMVVAMAQDFTYSTTSYVGSAYEGIQIQVDNAAILAKIDASSMSEVTMYAVTPAGRTADYRHGGVGADGWRQADGTFTTWNNNSVYYVQPDHNTGVFVVGGMQGYNLSAITHTSEFIYVNNTTGAEASVNIVLAYIEEGDYYFDIVKTIDITHYEKPNVAYCTEEPAPKIDIDEACQILGMNNISQATSYIVNVSDGKYKTNTTDGWRDANGDAAAWGDATNGFCVKFDYVAGEFDYTGAHDPNFNEGDTYTAKWALTYNGKAIIYNVNIIFGADPNEEHDPVYTIQKVFYIDHLELAKAAYSTVEPAPTFDVEEVCDMLGISDISLAKVYVVDMAGGEFHPNNTDGWRDRMGNAAQWGDATNGFCVKLNNPQTGMFDYTGAHDTNFNNGETFTVRFGLAYGSKAVILEVNITFGQMASMAVNAQAQYGTFCAPFDVQVPAGVTASTATINANGKTIDLTSVGSTIPANTPVILYAESGLEQTTLFGVGTDGTPTAGCLTGVYTETAAPMGSYVMQLQDGVGFYRVASDNITISANRCYLSASASQAKALYISSDDATAIKAIDALTSGNADIYTTDGVKVNSLQKGINIIKTADGKTQKVLVK